MADKRNKSLYLSAVGLAYDAQQMSTPSISVKGERLQADTLVKLAKRYGVPVIESPDLSRSLLQLELDQEIPAELFEPVALILSELKRVIK